jgi:hypothetical protein
MAMPVSGVWVWGPDGTFGHHAFQADRMRINAEGLHSVGGVVGHHLQGHNIEEGKREGILVCGWDFSRSQGSASANSSGSPCRTWDHDKIGVRLRYTFSGQRQTDLGGAPLQLGAE